jgi:DNA polymerase IV
MRNLAPPGGRSPHWVLHVDLDQFLAAVELRRRPDLRGLPVVVGGNGDPDEPRKVVTCASYEARGYGVHAGMPLRAAARRCPDAVFLPSDPDAYDAASAEVMGLLRDLGHPVEVWGWDEAYLAAGTDDPAQLAHRIRALVAAETGLSCSVGISDNKQRAKVATGFGKPESAAAGPRARGTTPLAEPGEGVFTLTDANWMDVMGDRGVESLWGVGPRTAKKLGALDITTVRELAATDAELLVSTFGPRTGLWLLLLAKGGGDADVSAEPWVPRSRSHVVTFPVDLTDRSEMESAITELASRTLTEVTAEHRVVNRVAVTVRTATFYTRTRVRKLAAPTTDPGPITAAAVALLDLFELDRPVRLLGVRLELVMPD